MSSHYTIGLDFGTNSARALIVDVRDGREVASGVSNYLRGDAGVILDPAKPDLARQHPADYLLALQQSVRGAMNQARSDREYSPAHIIGIGVDTTGSTPMPLDAEGCALALNEQFANDSDAMAWLWKDHTSHVEAEEITRLAAAHRPDYLTKCGGRYSSEWFWAKILRCARVNPTVFQAASTWVELCDWITAILCANLDPAKLGRGICAAGHKGLFHPQWGGYPDAEFLAMLDPGLVRIRESLPTTALSIDHSAGRLSERWADLLGLPNGLPIAMGALDAHLGAVGAGITDGTLIKILGTSSCDIMITPMDRPAPEIPGLCGIVPESVLPGYYGLEAGQSAVGDIYNWFVSQIHPAGKQLGGHETLTQAAEKLRPGQTGLLALDWHNGNRSILTDQRLSGMIVGLSLHTQPAEIYRALIESTAFGARTIIAQFEKSNIPVQRVINCGGIAARNPLAMQIYADVLNVPVAITRSLQTCALGSAIAGAVIAGAERGGYADFGPAISAMTGAPGKVFSPIADHSAVYNQLYGLYRQLHDSFGVRGTQMDQSNVMKDLLRIRDSA